MTAATDLPAEWIARTAKAHPPRRLDNGNCLTGLVRLSFVYLFEKSKPIAPNPEGKYSASLIFPPDTDLTPLKTLCGEIAKAKWPTAGTPQGPKLKTPFKDQGEMALKYEGFNESGSYVIATSDKRIPVVDQRMQPITDETKVYSGAWAIVSLRPFAYDKGVNKGVAFGLQSVMIVADDKALGGGASRPDVDFAGVSIDASVNPAAAFGAEAPAAGKDASSLF